MTEASATITSAGNEHASVLQSAKVVSGVTLVSRVLGLLRDRAAAHLFGVSWVWDAFALAFMIPNLFRRLFGEGSLSAAFLPVFTKTLEDEGRPAAWRLMRIVSGWLLVGLGSMAVLVVVATFLLPDRFWLWAMDTTNGTQAQIFRWLVLILFPYVVIICVSALYGAALNVLRSFALPAAIPVVLNVVWLAVLYAIMTWLPVDPASAPAEIARTQGTQIFLTAGAVLLGGLAGLSILIVALKRRGATVRPKVASGHPGWITIRNRLAPTILGLGLLQVNVLLDNVIAQAFVDEAGAVSALYYGNRLLQFPLAILGVAMGVAVFPLLARHAARGDSLSLTRSAAEAARMTLYLGLPATVGLWVLREPILAALLMGGEFQIEALARTSAVLGMYALGVASASLIQVLSRTWFAMGDTKTPMKIALSMAALNVVGNLILVHTPLREAGVALSTAISSWGNVALLGWFLRRQLIQRVREEQPADIPKAGTVRRLILSVLRAGIAAIIMGIALVFVLREFPAPSEAGMGWQWLCLAVTVPLGVVVYGFASLSLRAQEPRELLRRGRP